ncbi:hypothetical protein N658DRAFT_486283 [Parathielavia hyrcaniae]|uniref:C2H2-type domain-containing protein n=1 Tax=Parathielavia hyrcaniae TaxID=113614 RepID=A0AAN6Q0H9_9PEZI|nr:hypothetical protein N658DRAFT_486283 [Parathielavia hyrcaniae]
MLSRSIKFREEGNLESSNHLVDTIFRGLHVHWSFIEKPKHYPLKAHGYRAATSSEPAQPGWDPEEATIDPQLLSAGYPPTGFLSQDSYSWGDYPATVSSPSSSYDSPPYTAWTYPSNEQYQTSDRQEPYSSTSVATSLAAGIDHGLDAGFSHAAVDGAAHGANTLPSWPTQDSSFPSHPSTDPTLVAQINDQPNGFDYYNHYYTQDAGNQQYGPDDGDFAPAGPSSAPAGPERPYKCTFTGCTHSERRQCDLTKHMKNHTKPNKCDICVAGGAETKDLNRHMWTNHPAEAKRRGVPKDEVQCPGCEYKGRKDNVKRHWDTIHKKKH